MSINIKIYKVINKSILVFTILLVFTNVRNKLSNSNRTQTKETKQQQEMRAHLSTQESE